MFLMDCRKIYESVKWQNPAPKILALIVESITVRMPGQCAKHSCANNLSNVGCITVQMPGQCAKH